MTQQQINILANSIKDDNLIAFKNLFDYYYKNLCINVHEMICDFESSRDIVQEVFIKLWESRNKLPLFDDFEGYVYRTTKNSALNYLKRLSQNDKYADFIVKNAKLSYNQYEYLDSKELSILISNCIDSQPELSKKIFMLNKSELKKQKDIAKMLGLSIKTVEWHISNVKKEIKKLLNLKVTSNNYFMEKNPSTLRNLLFLKHSNRTTMFLF